jgi:hypothetical protein
MSNRSINLEQALMFKNSRQSSAGLTSISAQQLQLLRSIVLTSALSVCLKKRKCLSTADPAPASGVLTDESIKGLSPLPQPAAPLSPSLPSGYRIGQRIPIGLQFQATITNNAFFSLPIDSFSGYCVDGAHPIGMGINMPHMSTVRRVRSRPR